MQIKCCMIAQKRWKEPGTNWRPIGSGLNIKYLISFVKMSKNIQKWKPIFNKKQDRIG